MPFGPRPVTARPGFAAASVGQATNTPMEHMNLLYSFNCATRAEKWLLFQAQRCVEEGEGEEGAAACLSFINH